MRILFYTHTVEGYGLGNIYRMLFLYKHIKSLPISYVHFESPNNISKTIATQYNIPISNILLDFYDIILFDSPYNFMFTHKLPPEVYETILNLKKKCTLFIGLDYCRFEENLCDIAINLYNHNKENLKKFTGKIYAGLEYTILKPDIISAKKTNPTIKNTFLICIGGEDPCSHALMILNKFQDFKHHFSIVLGPANKNKHEIQKIVTDKNNYYESVTNMGELLMSHKIIICNGGTTLLESLYLEKNIIPIGQSEIEDAFISNIPAHFFSVHDIPKLIEEKSVYCSQKNLIDDKGKERIASILLQEFENKSI